MSKEEGQSLTNFFKPTSSKATTNEAVNFVKKKTSEESSEIKLRPFPQRQAKNVLTFTKSPEKRLNSEIKKDQIESVHYIKQKQPDKNPRKNFFKPKNNKEQSELAQELDSLWQKQILTPIPKVKNDEPKGFEKPQKSQKLVTIDKNFQKQYEGLNSDNLAEKIRNNQPFIFAMFRNIISPENTLIGHRKKEDKVNNVGEVQEVHDPFHEEPGPSKVLLEESKESQSIFLPNMKLQESDALDSDFEWIDTSEDDSISELPQNSLRRVKSEEQSQKRIKSKERYLRRVKSNEPFSSASGTSLLQSDYDEESNEESNEDSNEESDDESVEDEMSETFTREDELLMILREKNLPDVGLDIDPGFDHNVLTFCSDKNVRSGGKLSVFQPIQLNLHI